PDASMRESRARCRRGAAKSGLGLVILDCRPLMAPRRRTGNRVQEVSEISRSLKILARERDVPVIALSQLSRNGEYRADKRPLLADLRESGWGTAGTRIPRADTAAEGTVGQRVGPRGTPPVRSRDHSCVRHQPIPYATKDEASVAAVTDAARHFGVTAIRDDYPAAHCVTVRLPAPYRLTHGKRNPIAAWLDGLGLFGLRSYEKFV